MNIKSKYPLLLVFCLLALLTACAPSTGTPSPATPSTAEAASPTPAKVPLTALPASPSPVATLTATPTPSPTPNPPLRFAVIGDFGEGNQAEADVAKLVQSWKPDMVITVGDNNYPDGKADTIDAHIGKYYHDFIFPYAGKYGAGATENRFFPTLGNHDWNTPGAQPYLDYFSRG